MTSTAVGEELYLNEEQKDVVFLVGPDDKRCVRFPAHKLVLSLASPVFSAMLSENFKQGQSGQVTVTDITPSAFANLLQFAYTGEFGLATTATFKNVLYAAEKYLMPTLSKFCFANLENDEVTFENFWNFFNIVCMFYSDSMPAKIVIETLQYLDENADQIFSSVEWKHLHAEGVTKILKRSTLKTISETKILSCVLQWLKMECCRQKLDVTADNAKTVMKNIKFFIRYLLIPRGKLLDVTKKCFFLTQTEKTFILDSSLRETTSIGDGLPSPWNRSLLREPRGKSNTLKIDLYPTTMMDCAVIHCELLLVVSRNCIFEALEVNVQPDENKTIHVNGEITDLEGNIYDTWTKTELSNSIDRPITIGKPICLKKFKVYKCNLVCVSGRLVKRYGSYGICDDASGTAFLFVGNFRCFIYSKTADQLMRSSEFWEKFMSYKCDEEEFSNSAENNVVKSVTIII